MSFRTTPAGEGLSTSEAVPSLNYIGRQLDVSYTGRHMYGDIQRQTYRPPKYMNYTTTTFYGESGRSGGKYQVPGRAFSRNEVQVKFVKKM